MRKLKDLALHLPLAGLDRSSSSSPTSSPRHPRPHSPLASALSTSSSTASASAAGEGESSHQQPTPTQTHGAAPLAATGNNTILDRRRNLGPLHQACKQGDLVTLHGLLLSAISPSSASPEEVGEPAAGDFAGWLPIHLLLASRALSPLAAHPPEIPLLPLLSALLNSPLKGSLVNVKNGQGMTPLHLAVSRGCAPYIIRHLLVLGADPTITVKGKTCVQLAQNEETVKLLLNSRAPSNSGPLLTKASSRLNIRRSMDLPSVVSTAPDADFSSASITAAPPPSSDTSSTSNPSASSSQSSASSSPSSSQLSPSTASTGGRPTSPKESRRHRDSAAPSEDTSPLTSPRDTAGSSGGGGIRRKSSTIKKKKHKSATLTKHRSRPPSPPTGSADDQQQQQPGEGNNSSNSNNNHDDELQRAVAAALAAKEQQQRWAAEQQRSEWARIVRERAQRADEERTIYLLLCLLSALVAVVGGHLCGYYMGRLDAGHHLHLHHHHLHHQHNHQALLAASNNASTTVPPSSLTSFIFSFFFSSSSSSSSPPPPPPAAPVVAASLPDVHVLGMLGGDDTFVRLSSSSLCGGLVAFAGLLGLYHFGLKLLHNRAY